MIDENIEFVNSHLSFSIKEIQKNYFPNGLKVLNDVQLQINALKNYPKESMILIGNNNDCGNDTKILIVPGTGLGLGILNNNNSIATEAGHINLPNNDSFLKKILETFYKEHNRAATFEDLLSGKGISFIYGHLSGNKTHNLCNEDILNNKFNNNYCLKVKELLIRILAIFSRYGALSIGSLGGVYLSGSLTNTLLDENNFFEFRRIFEDSKTMKRFLQKIPIFLIDDNELGFKGAIEVMRDENY